MFDLRGKVGLASVQLFPKEDSIRVVLGARSVESAVKRGGVIAELLWKRDLAQEKTSVSPVWLKLQSELVGRPVIFQFLHHVKLPSRL